jgi:hypothetical protein
MDPRPLTQLNSDPDPQPCFWRYFIDTCLRYLIFDADHKITEYQQCFSTCVVPCPPPFMPTVSHSPDKFYYIIGKLPVFDQRWDLWEIFYEPRPDPNITLKSSVADPNPDPSDPCVFGPPGSGSGSSSQRYGSGSGSIYHQAKIVKKTLIPTVS